LLRRVGTGRLYKRQCRDGDREGVRQGNRRRATREVNGGGGTHTIKAFYSGRELLTLHSFEK